MRVEVDPGLYIHEHAFDAWVCCGALRVPAELRRLVAETGEDARALAGYMLAFPASVATAIGVDVATAVERIGEFIETLAAFDVDVSDLVQPQAARDWS